MDVGGWWRLLCTATHSAAKVDLPVILFYVRPYEQDQDIDALDFLLRTSHGKRPHLTLSPTVGSESHTTRGRLSRRQTEGAFEVTPGDEGCLQLVQTLDLEYAFYPRDFAFLIGDPLHCLLSHLEVTFLIEDPIDEDGRSLVHLFNSLRFLRHLNIRLVTDTVDDVVLQPLSIELSKAIRSCTELRSLGIGGTALTEDLFFHLDDLPHLRHVTILPSPRLFDADADATLEEVVRCLPHRLDSLIICHKGVDTPDFKSEEQFAGIMTYCEEHEIQLGLDARKEEFALLDADGYRA